jgi:HD superfamily phosphodiesterase
MNLSDKILSAERKFKKPLEDFFTTAWGNTILASHDIDHHRRVWHYSKELLAETDPLVFTSEPDLAQKLIIACYLHDIGMSEDPGTEHGKPGREKCREFLLNNNLTIDDNQDVLNAILNHDKKEYIDRNNGNFLQIILSVSDDLDAFGYIGIYRYTEIYLARGVPKRVIGDRIRENARKRYLNFLAIFGSRQGIIERHEPRYFLLDNFFNSYNQKSEGYNFNDNNPSGHCGVIDLISEISDNRTSLDKILSARQRFSGDPVISSFLTGLSLEMNESHQVR